VVAAAQLCATAVVVAQAVVPIRRFPTYRSRRDRRSLTMWASAAQVEMLEVGPTVETLGLTVQL
jgi:hypothetical protein